MPLNIEALVLECAARLGIDANQYAIAEVGPVVPAEFPPPSPLERHGYLLSDVNDYIALLTTKQRAQGDLPLTGLVYFITDDATEAMPTQAERDALAQNQSARLGIFTLADFPHIYVKSTDLAATAWRNTCVFMPGVKDSQVLGYVKRRVEENKNTNPGQVYPGRK